MAEKKNQETEVEETETTEEESSEGKGRARVYHVSYDAEDGTWRIFLEKGKTIYRFATKEEALNRVKELAKNNQRSYVVHLKNGKMQKK